MRWEQLHIYLGRTKHNLQIDLSLKFNVRQEWDGGTIYAKQQTFVIKTLWLLFWDIRCITNSIGFQFSFNLTFT